MMPRTVTIPDTYRGPMDLLLHLIRRDEIDVNNIPVASLTKSFLDELEKTRLVDVDEASEFLDMASRLLEIKSRLLLPADETAADEDAGIDDDPRSGLVAALLEYRRFSGAARLLDELREEHSRRFPHIPPPFDSGAEGEGMPSATAYDLLHAFQTLLLRLLPQEQSSEIVDTEIPTEVRVRQIEAVLSQIDLTRFSLLLSSRPTKAEAIGFFIAILELVRMGKVTARQSVDFGDIVIERNRPADISPTCDPCPPARRARHRCFLPLLPPCPAPTRKAPRPEFLSAPRDRGTRIEEGRAVPAPPFPGAFR